MIASQIISMGRVKLVNVPNPKQRPNQAVIKPELVTICGSDLREVYSLPTEAYPLSVGLSGHEIVGRVMSLDSSSINPEGVAVGDRVLALAPRHNGMAEELAVPISDLILLRDGLESECLVLAQQLGTVIYACQKIGNIIGKHVVVIGQGSAGLFFTAMLRRLGAYRITVCDLSNARIRAGLKLGADEAFNGQIDDPVKRLANSTEGSMADLVVEAAGEPGSINLALKMVRHGGRILFFGVPKQGSFPIDFDALFRVQCQTVSVSGAHLESGKRSIRMALNLIERGEIDVIGMITHMFSLHELEKAYRVANTRSDNALKVGVNFEDCIKAP